MPYTMVLISCIIWIYEVLKHKDYIFMVNSKINIKLKKWGITVKNFIAVKVKAWEIKCAETYTAC